MSGPDGVLLRTENLTRSFGSLVAVNAVSLTVRRGELRSIIGPNGAGKTTFFRLVSGEMEPSSGRVVFQEADITGLPQHRVCRLGIAKSYQITNIFPHLSVLENVRVAVQGYARSFNFWSRADALRVCQDRAVEILSDMLDFAKPTPLELVPVELAKVLDEALDRPAERSHRNRVRYPESNRRRRSAWCPAGLAAGTNRTSRASVLRTWSPSRNG